MSLDIILEEYPKAIELKGGFRCQIRPLEPTDEIAFHDFFLAVPTQERMFIKHRVTEPEIIHEWCQQMDLGGNRQLLSCLDGQIIAAVSLHHKLGGWSRHSERVR